MTEDEIYEKVFGPERPQRERGITSKELWGELRKQLDESKQRQEESEQRCVAEVQGLKEQLGRVEGLFSEQMNRFEGLLVQLASQVSSPVQTERPTVNPPSQRGMHFLILTFQEVSIWLTKKRISYMVSGKKKGITIFLYFTLKYGLFALTILFVSWLVKYESDTTISVS